MLCGDPQIDACSTPTCQVPPPHSLDLAVSKPRGTKAPNAGLDRNTAVVGNSRSVLAQIGALWRPTGRVFFDAHLSGASYTLASSNQALSSARNPKYTEFMCPKFGLSAEYPCNIFKCRLHYTNAHGLYFPFLSSIPNFEAKSTTASHKLYTETGRDTRVARHQCQCQESLDSSMDIR